MVAFRIRNRLFILTGIILLLLFVPFSGANRAGHSGNGSALRDIPFVPDLLAFDDTVVLNSLAEIDPLNGGFIPGGNDLLGGGDLLSEDDLLKRKLDPDVGDYDLEMIEAEEGGEVECWENEIDIPENALEEDTTVGFYIARSPNLEYWIYPPSLAFNDTVEVKLSYDFADLMWVDESSISIVQWVPLLDSWQNIGGVVDTLENEVTLKISTFGPPSGNFTRYALADHN